MTGRQFKDISVLAGTAGLEPTISESKSEVLPFTLHPYINGINAVPAHHLAHQCLHGNRTQLSSRQTSMNETESNRPFGGEGRCRPHSPYFYDLTV